MNEYCADAESKKNFLNLVSYLDSGIKPKDIEFNLPLVNYNLMELDEEMKLNSICPAVRKFFEQEYDPINFSSDDQNLMKKFLLDIYTTLFRSIKKQKMVQFSKN